MVTKSLKSHWKYGAKFGKLKGCVRNKVNKVFKRYSVKRISNLKLKIKVVKRRSRQFPRLSWASNNTNIYTVSQNFNSLKCIIKRVKNVNLHGYRMINLKSLQTFMNSVISHAKTCEYIDETTMEPFSIVREDVKQGLASTLSGECNGCRKCFRFCTSPKLNNKGTIMHDINARAVWGSVATGTGASQLGELMATMDAPSISSPAFTAMESRIGSWWEDVSLEEMLEAGAEERRIAIEKGQFHQGVPAIAVIADGGWSKRSHKHSYDALGGVGIIIGKETGKLLHIGIKNKYCVICERSSNVNEKPQEHECFKNWDESSQKMESSSIVEGFQKAEKTHGVRYMWLVADGDSSVYARITEEVEVWGKDVKKIECANHACKCLRSNLEKLVEANPAYKGKNKLTKQNRIRIVSAVRCAIRLRSKEEDKASAVQKLRKDINNTVHHVFGNHSGCSDFCKAKTNTCSNDTAVETHPNNDETQPAAITICDDTASFWLEGSSLTAQEESRGPSTSNIQMLDKNMLTDISVLLNRLANKADRLIDNTTTNLAENWMSIRMKFDGGKVKNLCQRGSWSTRCHGAVLRKNKGTQWSPSVWETCTGTEAGADFKAHYSSRDRHHQRTINWKNKPIRNQRRWKRKLKATTQAASKKAKAEYGPTAVDQEADVDEQTLSKMKDQFIESHINISEERINVINNQTTEQSSSEVWKNERKKRLTASNIGIIMKRRTKTPVTKIVSTFLHSSFQGNANTLNGIKKERTTKREYVLKKAEEGENVEIRESGLVVCKENKYLGASPDGIVYSNNNPSGLIEIKNVLLNKNVNLSESALKDKGFCLKIVKGQLSLKRNHIYYYQCQSLLNICDFPWLDFVVRCENPYQLHIERIYKDTEEFNSWLPKLKAFYFNVLLPELACPRYGKVPGIREPGVWYSEDVSKNPTARRHPSFKEHV